MWKYVVAAALCAASAGAWAQQTIVDPVTGLSFEFISSGSGSPLSSVTQRTDGYTLATESQLAALLQDIFGPIPLVNVTPYDSHTPAPAPFETIWSLGVVSIRNGAESSYETFIAAANCLPGYVDFGGAERGYEDTGFPNGEDYYGVGISDGSPIAYTTIYENDSFVLVSAVPEPSTWALMAGGLLMVAQYRLRNTQRG